METTVEPISTSAEVAAILTPTERKWLDDINKQLAIITVYPPRHQRAIVEGHGYAVRGLEYLEHSLDPNEKQKYCRDQGNYFLELGFKTATFEEIRFEDWSSKR